MIMASDLPDDDWQDSRITPGVKRLCRISPKEERQLAKCPRCGELMRPSGFKSCPSEDCTLMFKFFSRGSAYVWDETW